jgi:hypothetical protein
VIIDADSALPPVVSIKVDDQEWPMPHRSRSVSRARGRVRRLAQQRAADSGDTVQPHRLTQVPSSLRGRVTG